MKVNKIEILTTNVLLRAAKIEIIETKYFTDISKYKQNISINILAVDILPAYTTNTAV